MPRIAFNLKVVQAQRAGAKAAVEKQRLKLQAIQAHLDAMDRKIDRGTNRHIKWQGYFFKFLAKEEAERDAGESQSKVEEVEEEGEDEAELPSEEEEHMAMLVEEQLEDERRWEQVEEKKKEAVAGKVTLL